MTPIESECTTIENAVAHDARFRTKVERALASPRSGIPRDQVKAEMRAIIERTKRR